MESEFLKRRLNPFLVASTVLILALLAGLSVLYQGQLSDVLSDKEDLETKIDSKNQELEQLRSEKANLTNKLKDRESDIDSYVNETQKLEQDISSLESEISSLESDKSDLENEKEGLKDEIDSLEINISETEEQLQDINNTLEDICEFENNTVQNGDEKCEDWNHDFEGSEP